MTPKPERKAFVATRESRCDECGETLSKGTLFTLEENAGCLCLPCAELDSLVFLPSGNAALTRRAKKASGLSAVVLRWARARKRYERKGILVEEAALEQAERDCLQDEDARARQRARAAVKREELDQTYLKAFAERVRELYPQTPRGREISIAEHACRKYSGRVGRSAEAKALDSQAVTLAVAAHIRHQETDYDQLLLDQVDRAEARHRVAQAVAATLEAWRG